MNIILLSGGSGTRLWPLSNDVRSKQFLKILPGRESMAQRMYRGIRSVCKDANITIATSQDQVSQIKAQLGDDVGISVEPCRRDTFPAIALACAYLKEKGVADEEPVIVCPVDPFVEDDYFACLKELSDAVESGHNNLTLMGIEPSYPSEKYGYIITDGDKVTEFREKPNAEKAAEYISSGALWNGGVFGFKSGYVLNIAREQFGTDDYNKLFDNYAELTKISFDYAVVEKEDNIGVVRYSGAWKDLGTWNTLTEAMSEKLSGNAVALDCENTHVINELSIPMVALGIKDAVVVATPDGILVSDKKESARLKEVVKSARPMYEKRVWGEYKVLDYQVQSDNHNSLTKHLVIAPGQHISYQFHEHRTEMWTFVDGEGELIIDGESRRVKRGDFVEIPAGTRHAIKALTELHIIEVQIGTELTEEDITRLDYEF